MNKKIILNPCVSYKKNEFAYVFYYDFNYIFFTNEAAKLIEDLFYLLNTGKKLNTLPETFLDYLLKKKILLEVKNV